jgi:hypothetical protein
LVSTTTSSSSSSRTWLVLQVQHPAVLQPWAAAEVHQLRKQLQAAVAALMVGIWAFRRCQSCPR